MLNTHDLYGPFTFSVFKDEEVLLLRSCRRGSMEGCFFSGVHCVKYPVFKNPLFRVAVDGTVSE